MTRATQSPLRQTDFLILAVLDAGPLHGYGIVQQVDDLSDGRVQLRPGDVYRVLYRMQRQGLIEPVEVDDAEDERRTYYAITETGREIARAEAKLLSGVSARLLAGTASDGG